MNEGEPKKPDAVEKQEANPLLERAQGFTADESEGYREAIAGRAQEETIRPGILKRMATSARARMAMTIVAGATALTMGGAPDAGAAERGRTGRVAIAAALEGAQRKLSGGRWEDVVGGVVGAGVEQYGREKDAQRRREISQDRRHAQEARTQAHEAEREMRDAEYKLRRIEAELPRIERQIKTAQYDALKLAATDAGAKEVRAIMLKRTGVKIELWKAGYEDKTDQVESLSRQDRELEESLMPHLTGRIAQRTGDLFVNTIMPGELKMLDLEGQQGHLRKAMGSAGAEMREAMGRWEAHTERAQRAHELANIGIRVGRY